jgi:hypothetical protein
LHFTYLSIGVFIKAVKSFYSNHRQCAFSHTEKSQLSAAAAAAEQIEFYMHKRAARSNNIVMGRSFYTLIKTSLILFICRYAD